MITHDPNKKYACNQCTKRFSLPQYLREHMVVHSSARPFVCKFPNCGKTFRQAGKLSMHKKSHYEELLEGHGQGNMQYYDQSAYYAPCPMASMPTGNFNQVCQLLPLN